MQLLTVFVFGFVCLSAVSAKPMTDEQKAHMKESMEKCVAKSGVDVALIERSKTAGEFIDDEKLYCFAACMMQDMGIMDEAGEILPEEVMKKKPDSLSQDKVEELLNLCAKEKGGNPCETATQVLKCLHDNKAMEMIHMSKK